MPTQTSSAASTQGTRFDRKRALIIKSAAHAFGRKGFHATTLEEIAADLNVTKASLYYYFSTKEELLYEVHLLSMHDVLSRLQHARSQPGTPVEHLQTIIRKHLTVLAGDYEGSFLLQQEYHLPDNYRQEIVGLRDRYEHEVREIIEEGVRQRLFRVKDARIAVRMILGAINWFLRWYRAGGPLTADEIADAYIDFILYGLLAPPTAIPMAVPAQARRRARAAARKPIRAKSAQG